MMLPINKKFLAISIIILIMIILGILAIVYFQKQSRESEPVFSNQEEKQKYFDSIKSWEDLPTTLAPFDSTKIVEDPELGTKIVSNRIVVFFKEGTTLDDIKEVVDSINGRIVGYVSRGDLFQIEIPDTDDASGVHVVMNKLINNPKIKSVMPSIIPTWR